MTTSCARSWPSTARAAAPPAASVTPASRRRASRSARGRRRAARPRTTPRWSGARRRRRPRSPGGPGAAPQEQCDGDQAQAERHHARVEVRLQRVHGRVEDLVAERQPGHEAGDAPPGPVQCAADADRRTVEQQEGQHVACQEGDGHRDAGAAQDRREPVVEREQAVLRGHVPGEMREQLRVDAVQHDRYVERLVRDAEPVAADIEQHEDAEGAAPPARSASRRTRGRCLMTTSKRAAGRADRLHPLASAPAGR